MFVRWIVVLLLGANIVGAIQRPETKATLRSLIRLPRVEPRFSLDFAADRGFAVFDTSKDPGVAAIELREKAAGKIDGKLYLDLAALRQTAGDFNSAARDLQRAADALRRRLDAEPGNSRARIDLGSALHGLGRASEAESILRDAVKAAPSATNFVALSAFLEARAWEIAADTSNWRGRRSYAELCRRMALREPSAETADRAARLLDESLGFAREAVALDEDSATAQYRLAISIASKECFEAMRRRISGKEYSPPSFETAIFSEAALPALEKAAELEPENPIRLATAILWRALAVAGQKRISISDGGIWELLPDATRHRIESGLESLGRFDGSSASGAAAQALGTLRFVLQNDFNDAADDLRAAIASIPESEQLWETLALVLVRSEDLHELGAICEARVMVRPSVRNRVLFANAHEKLGNRARAIEELTGALALNSNDFTANLSLAALLMRDSQAGGVPPRVRQSLVNAERAIRASASGSQLVDLALAQSVYHCLIDETERAREILKAALAYDKEDAAIAAALSAIGH